ncbi:MAG: hypothetical protein GDA56_30255 [Hormoscilla sp. GM7CHS1pb]|nr:hypothetical protein [Hormoscilla sp. GM7CHS1pb]
MTSSRNVQRHLERTVEEGEAPSDQQLVFDPQTGQLVVQRQGSRMPSPDAVVADQITEDGFFRNQIV